MDLISRQQMSIDDKWGINTTTTGPACKHCGKECSPVELEKEVYEQIDALGPESLPEIHQAIWEGLVICESCYYKEMGL